MKEISERQKEIIEAAGKLLSNSGMSGLTTKKLAQEMGFSEAAIYRHFENKEAIIIGLLQFLRADMDQRLVAAIKENNTPEAKFKAIFKSQFDFFSENPHFVVAVFSDGLLEASEKINQAILHLMQTKISYLMPVILDGQQKGIFTQSITSEELVHIIIGSFRLQMFKWKIANFQFDLRRNGQNIIESLLTIIKP
ncbi:TetR/AcrR family transcriptional regulator [Aquiflexum gelatinilyticum]|uniref:TetR/AcrR family transcriptional regulator n=1 Tax=Aquiflexum gelatinilyticum TaxID=2961943 RepID=A0A9X2P221_9BACT|nr:TetR/AcrR family transcriptional regulator [Aquiflexum gelatinilyticum]MCR9013868.1 TetR/AcrR family transcriptional regulator [Aquiflexum gelatinilyticum]